MFRSFSNMNFTNKEAVYKPISWLIIAFGIPTFLMLLKFRAPYGRYAPANLQSYAYNRWIWGPAMDPKPAWIIQECAAFLVPVILLLSSFHFKNLYFPLGANAPTFLLGLFLFHYFQRSFIYPLRIRGGKPTPLVIVAGGLIYCSLIGLIQYLALSSDRDLLNAEPYKRPHFMLGCIMFLFGMWVNLEADAELRTLRRPRGDTGYRMPKRGMHRYVSAANYFGECLEWCGFALASWNVAAVAFAFFTICNLAPRAYQHHQWYKQKFDNYPARRKAFIPFVI